MRGGQEGRKEEKKGEERRRGSDFASFLHHLFYLHLNHLLGCGIEGLSESSCVDQTSGLYER